MKSSPAGGCSPALVSAVALGLGRDAARPPPGTRSRSAWSRSATNFLRSRADPELRTGLSERSRSTSPTSATSRALPAIETTELAAGNAPDLLTVYPGLRYADLGLCARQVRRSRPDGPEAVGEAVVPLVTLGRQVRVRGCSRSRPRSRPSASSRTTRCSRSSGSRCRRRSHSSSPSVRRRRRTGLFAFVERGDANSSTADRVARRRDRLRRRTDWTARVEGGHRDASTGRRAGTRPSRNSST